MILRSLHILITGDLMLRTYFAALVSFALPLSFGALFRFVPLESFWLIPLFLPCTAEPVWAFTATVELLSQKWHVFNTIS